MTTTLYKVTPERIQYLLENSTFHYSRLHGTTTVCQVVLPNGFSVAMGTSACVDPVNFNEALGRDYAKKDAITKAKAKLWELEGYALAMQLHPIQ